LSAGKLETLARPLYQQVVDIMVRRIAEGKWKSGEMLPSEPKIALELGVSPGTVRKALDQLAADQLVTRKQGLGTSVAVSTRADMLYRFFKLIDTSGARFMPDCEEVMREIVTPDQEMKNLFNLKSKAKVANFLRRRNSDDRPVMTEMVTLPLPLFKGLDKLKNPLPTTLYDYFENEYNLKILRVEEILTAVNATNEDAKLLNVKKGTALLAIKRIAYTFSDQPVEHRLFRLLTENHAYLSELT